MAEASGPIILDTDVASLIIKRRLDPADARLYRHTWCVTFVTVGELVKGASMAAWDLAAADRAVGLAGPGSDPSV